MMKSLRLLLNEFIELTLNEAATPTAGLALLLVNNNANKTSSYVLYDPKVYLDLVSDAIIDYDENVSSAKKGGFWYVGHFVSWSKFDNITGESLKQLIQPSGLMGMMIVSPAKNNCYNSYVVDSVAAVKGFGPQMYDIAMSDKGSLISDRSQVSHGAESIWKYYNSSRNDVTKRKLDDVDQPKTPPKEDDCRLHHDGREYLNYAYSLSSLTVNVNELRSNHNRFCSDVAKLLKNFGSSSSAEQINMIVSGMLLTNADNFFVEKYSAVQQAKHGL